MGSCGGNPRKTQGPRLGPAPGGAAGRGKSKVGVGRHSAWYPVGARKKTPRRTKELTSQHSNILGAVSLPQPAFLGATSPKPLASRPQSASRLWPVTPRRLLVPTRDSEKERRARSPAGPRGRSQWDQGAGGGGPGVRPTFPGARPRGSGTEAGRGWTALGTRLPARGPGEGRRGRPGSGMGTHLHGKMADVPSRARRTLTNIAAGTGATTREEVAAHGLAARSTAWRVLLGSNFYPAHSPRPAPRPHPGPAPEPRWTSTTCSPLR